MKKAMIMFATVALLAIGANAGQIQWLVSGVRDSAALTGSVDGTTTLNNGSTLAGAIAYLYVGTLDASALNAAIQDGTYTTAGSLASALTASTGTTGAQLYGNYVSEVVTAYVVVFQSGSYEAAGEGNYYISAAISRTFSPTGNQTYSFLMNSTTTSWTHYNNVPEPTSMALLAIGVAAVGLRRKFRK